MERLALFDIDNTLVKGSGGHEKAFSEAFIKVYGIDADISIINYQGTTDQQIIIKVLKKKGLDEKEIISKIDKCMEAMVDSFKDIIKNEKMWVLEGVRELLEGLSREGVLIGLVTGNLEQIAREKMKKAGLDHYFKVGGFGSDDMIRANLVRLSIRQAEKLGFRLNDNVFLFGDTPQDIKAGKDAKVKTIGVATGKYPMGELKGAGADFVVESLQDTRKVMSLIIKTKV